MKAQRSSAVVPTITIIVRHSRDCSHQSDETYKRCNCRKSLRYYVEGKQHTRSAQTRSWSIAEEERRKLEDRFRGGDAVQVETAARTTTERASELFVSSKQSQGINEGVLAKYTRELGRFVEFLKKRSHFFPADITLEDLTEFRAGWAELYPSSTTRAKVQERLRAFLRYCYESRLIDRVPKLSPIKVDEPPTLPLTKQQYERLLETIPTSLPDTVTIPGTKKMKHHTRASVVKNRAGKMRALIQLMRWSGLAIQDAVIFERAELICDEENKFYRVVTDRQKTGMHVSVPIPLEVGKELLVVLNGNPKYFFWTGEGEPRTAVSHYQEDFRKLFRDANIEAEGAMVSHRLRDTFAVHLLQEGVPIPEVSRALGHKSIKTTERYYAKWVKSRQDRLDRLVAGTF